MTRYTVLIAFYRTVCLNTHRIRQTEDRVDSLNVELGRGLTQPHQSQTASPVTPSPPTGPRAPTRAPAAPSPRRTRAERLAERDSQPPLPHARTFSRSVSFSFTHISACLTYLRLSSFSSLMSVTWFVTAHILVYTSVDTCRLASPHLWWLVFSIVALMYAQHSSCLSKFSHTS